MTRTEPPVLIEGLSPSEWAAQWGDPRTLDGNMFYEYGALPQDAEWLLDFSAAILRLADRVGRKPELYEPNDGLGLLVLHTVVLHEYQRAAGV